jgi:hypothetical protein
LPFVLAELWRLQELLSYSDIIPWQLTQDSSTQFPSTYLNGLQVRFKVNHGSGEGSVGPITFIASGRMMLGDIFYDMVLKEKKKGNKNIYLKSSNNEPYTWVFYTTDMLIWNRTLDPHKTLSQNRILKNTKIIAQRVSREAFETYTNKTEQNLVSS